MAFVKESLIKRLNEDKKLIESSISKITNTHAKARLHGLMNGIKETLHELKNLDF